MAHEHVYNGGRICEICGNSFGKPNTPKDGQMPDTNIYELNDEYQRKVFKSKYGYEMPNTDSRELQAIEDVFDNSGAVTFDPSGHFITVDDPHKLYRAILAYIANKQRELLEWVEQEVSNYYLHHDGEGEHKLFAEIDELLKNKRKEL